MKFNGNQAVPEVGRFEGEAWKADAMRLAEALHDAHEAIRDADGLLPDSADRALAAHSELLAILDGSAFGRERRTTPTKDGER